MMRNSVSVMAFFGWVPVEVHFLARPQDTNKGRAAKLNHPVRSGRAAVQNRPGALSFLFD
ncbi:MAG: hypothetical protein HC869_20755 [Rhodospirillales bacterium]|nr:hypothetical protein [Rhodospirillales bacterium]